MRPALSFSLVALIALAAPLALAQQAPAPPAPASPSGSAAASSPVAAAASGSSPAAAVASGSSPEVAASGPASTAASGSARKPLAPLPVVEHSQTSRSYRAPQWGLGFLMGPRYSWLRGKGFDPYNSNDLQLGVDVEAQLRVVNAGAFSVWALAGWSTGGVSESTRGLPTSLTFHDLHLGVVGYVRPWNRLGFYARAAPGAHYFKAKLAPLSLPHALIGSEWTWGLEASAGASLLLGAAGNDAWPSARFWLNGDLGYAATGSVAMKVKADVPDDEAARYGSTSLPALSGSGVLLRFAFGVTF